MRRLSLVTVLAALTVGISACKITESEGLKGKIFTGSYTGSKSGPMTCTMTDELNCQGTWTVNNYPCTLTVGVNPSGAAGGSINCPTGTGSVSGNLATGSFNGTWYGTLPVSGNSGTTASYNGSFSSMSGGGSSGGSTASLVGTWDMNAGSLLVARQTFTGSSTAGTNAVRTWSTTLPQLDGVYAEYSYTATSSSYTTTATLILMCDFLKGQWTASSQRPSGTLSYSLSSDGNTVTFGNGDKYTRSTASISKPTAGGSCTKQ